MNLKIPAKRIFGDNFEPGECCREGRLDVIGSGFERSGFFFDCATSGRDRVHQAEASRLARVHQADRLTSRSLQPVSF